MATLSHGFRTLGKHPLHACAHAGIVEVKTGVIFERGLCHSHRNAFGSLHCHRQKHQPPVVELRNRRHSVGVFKRIHKLRFEIAGDAGAHIRCSGCEIGGEPVFNSLIYNFERFLILTHETIGHRIIEGAEHQSPPLPYIHRQLVVIVAYALGTIERRWHHLIHTVPFHTAHFRFFPEFHTVRKLRKVKLRCARRAALHTSVSPRSRRLR